MAASPDPSGPPAAPSDAPGREADPRLVAAIVATALFMQNLDGAAVAVALPAMARDLGVDPLRLGTAITAYLVSLAVFIPVSGWVADRFGARRVFVAAIVVFAGASALCGAAQDLGMLLGARVLQGVGGAMMVPVGRLLLLRRVRKEELITATTWLTMPGLLGPILGPPLGGFLTDAVSWRAVFDINVPVGVLGVLAVLRWVPDAPPGDPGPLDLRGLVLFSTAVAALMVAVETAGRGLFDARVPLAAAAVALAAGWGTWRHARGRARPAVDFSLFRLPTFEASAVAGSMFRIGAGAAPFLVPLALQIGFGRSAAAAGLVSFTTAVGALLMKPLVRPVLRRFGFRRVVLWNAAVAAATIALLALIAPDWPLWGVSGLLLAAGMARSLQFTAYNTLAFAEVPPERLSAATSLSGLLQQLPQALGVALATATLELSTHLAGRAGPAMPDFAAGFAVAGLATLLAAPLAARLPRDAGAEVSGHREPGAGGR